MEELQAFLKSIAKPTVVVILTVFILVFTRSILDKTIGVASKKRAYRRVIMGVVTLACLMIFVFALPNEGNLRGQVVGLVGILISGAIALSSTTFLGNALAGIMSRSVNTFRPGDFISVNGHRGRVSVRGFFHTEIQSDDRDLTTLPNLFLATNPVKVTNSGGTVIRTKISLGYDEPRLKIEKLLIEAAERAELSDPFVQVVELGDFSVVYRVNGLLTDTSRFLSAQSKLNAMVLDSLHEANVEIVSPSFMNTRNVGTKEFIPSIQSPLDQNDVQTEQNSPEKIIFDKALQAELIEDHKRQLEEIKAEMELLKENSKKASSSEQKESCASLLKSKERRAKQLKCRILRMTDDIDKSK